jgi:uncharacterized repeat protein (TIGR03803 family)
MRPRLDKSGKPIMKARAYLWLLVLAFLTVRLSAAEMALQILHEFFPGAGPSYPSQPLLEEADGSFLSTSRGGAFGNGTVYRITRSGQVTVLHSFDYPYSGPRGLSRMPDGNLCGIVFTSGQVNVAMTILRFSTNDWSVSTLGTSDEYFNANPIFDGVVSYIGPTSGGVYGLDQVFRLTTNGSFASFFSFNGTNGSFPNSLIQGKDGLLYGTTEYGGQGFSGRYTGYGTVFKLTTNGALTTLAYFDPTNATSPFSAKLTFGSDQRLYGTTRGGAVTNWGLGTIFRVSTNGVFESLWRFDGTNGGRPAGGSGLIQALNGKFYGITAWGTVNTNAREGYVGTVYSITTNAEFSVVARFNGTNMVTPAAHMMLARDGNIYGVAADEVVAPSLNGNTGIFFRLAQVPEISSVTYTNGVVQLKWTSFTNGVYQIQSRTNLNATNWTTISSNLTASGSSLSFTHSTPITPQNFYRVVLLPQ